MKIIGYVIQDTSQDGDEYFSPEKKGCDYNYQGLMRYNPWPLRLRLYYFPDDEEARKISKEINEKWWLNGSGCDEILPSLEYVKRYIEYCDRRNISTRILQIEVEDKWDTDVCEELLPLDYVMGYEYCTSSYEYSLLYYGMGMDETIDYMKRLNNYGLLDSYEDVVSYVNFYQSLLEAGMNIEYYGEEYERIARIGVAKNIYTSL